MSHICWIYEKNLFLWSKLFPDGFSEMTDEKKMRLFLRWNTSGSRCNTHCLKQQSLIFIFLIKCPETHSAFYFNMCIVLIKWINVCVFDQFLLNKDQIWCFNRVRFISYGTVHYYPLLVEDQRTWTVWVNKNLFDVTWTKVIQWRLWTSVLISLIVWQAVMCLWNCFCKHQCEARFHGVIIQSVLSTNAKPACPYLPQINLRLHTQLLPNFSVAKQQYSYPPPTNYGMCAIVLLTTKNSILFCSYEKKKERTPTYFIQCNLPLDVGFCSCVRGEATTSHSKRWQ